ncbi:MAG TPA: DUF2550 domain-containing protein, partial [Nocardioidaceae bacterium]|nr:DUF2550 domain-containing protein [Nocardioidaceae bacterium]
ICAAEGSFALPRWEWVAESFGLLVVVAILAVIALIVRRRILARDGGTFELSVNKRRPSASGRTSRGWTLGLGRYSDEQLEWFRVFSLGIRPSLVLERGHVEVTSRRDPTGPEAFALYAGNVIVECRAQGRTIQLGLSPESLTALLAWLESGPPGRESGKVI